MRIVLLAISFFAFAGCLKNQETMGTATKLAVSNYVVNTSGIELLIDGNKVNSSALLFGKTTGDSGNVYVNIPAGVHNLIINQGTTTLFNKTIQTTAGGYYSLITTDSIRNSKVNFLLMTDDTTTIDTLARARFLHFIPGTDTLAALLIKGTDTVRISTGSTYMGLYPDASGIQAFDRLFFPGNYRLELFRNGVLYSTQPSIILEKRKIYSFIAKGASGGSGALLPSISVIAHN